MSLRDDIKNSANGEFITGKSGALNVPNNPIIAFIEGDGVGPDIWTATKNVLDSAVAKAYNGEKKIAWYEVFAGQKCFDKTGEWILEETFDAIRETKVAIKGPLTTPIGGGIRSLNVKIRQELDLHSCVRPVRYFKGVGAPVKAPELVDMVIYRENTEDVYSGIEFKEGTEDVKKIIEFFKKEFNVCINADSGIGIKPISENGTKRLVRGAIQYAIDNNRDSVTLVHKGNIMKFTEGAFRDWGYELAKQEFGAVEIDGGPWCSLKNPKNGKEIVIKDCIADAFLQQIVLRPAEYDVIATMNLNGDYISDALAAQVGGLGIAPGANIGDNEAVFEATHGTAPKYTGLNKVNPGSLILSGVMMLDHLGWVEASALIYSAMEKAISSKFVTYDLERQMENATIVSCTGFGDKLVELM